MIESNTHVRQHKESLAVIEGPPLFAEPVHVGRPNIGDRARFASLVTQIFDRLWLTNDGPLVREFEDRIARFVNVKHCIAMCNATVALEIAIRALDFKGEVIVPSYTFVATAHALQRQEITPVFADIDPKSYNIDPAGIERLITPRTTGILGVHVFGRPCDTRSIETIAARHRLRVMYDAAHAFGCSHNGRMIGSSGACEVFSFHATKFLNSFEGGALATNDDELASKVRLMRNFGFSGYDNVIYLGTNGKLTEVCAAMGLVSLDAMTQIVEQNRVNYHTYRRRLHGIPGLSVIDYDHENGNNFQYVVLEVDPCLAPLSRDELVSVLHAENVLARKYFWPGCHRMQPYRALQPNAGLLLPHTERVSERIVVLPTGQTVTADTAGLICDLISLAMREAPRVRAALGSAVARDMS